MEPNIKFSDLKTQWTPKQVQLGHNVCITVWEDPTGQFISLTPVASLSNFKSWWNSKVPFQLQIQHIQDQEARRRPERRLTYEDLNVESWFIAK